MYTYLRLDKCLPHAGKGFIKQNPKYINHEGKQKNTPIPQLSLCKSNNSAAQEKISIRNYYPDTWRISRNHLEKEKEPSTTETKDKRKWLSVRASLCNWYDQMLFLWIKIHILVVLRSPRCLSEYGICIGETSIKYAEGSVCAGRGETGKGKELKLKETKESPCMNNDDITLFLHACIHSLSGYHHWVPTCALLSHQGHKGERTETRLPSRSPHTGGTGSRAEAPGQIISGFWHSEGNWYGDAHDEAVGRNEGDGGDDDITFVVTYPL